VTALGTAWLACAAIAAACWLLSVITKEYSWVDRLWSIVPAGYVAYFAWTSGWTPRLTLILVLVTAWAARLTFNFARKGGYAKGGEDYRWAELRRRMSPAAFQVFNVFFVAGFQNALLCAITMPAWRAAQSQAPLNALDFVAAALFVSFLIGETIADEQQWRFQTEKKARRARGETISEEFVTTGLFRYSRHPNFFCEQAMWWTLCLFAVASGAPWLDWIGAGAIVLTALFQGSTSFTEELTLKKYPRYAAYQKTTSRLIPRPPRAASRDAA
jgi:steroid 5-alpha reductase family enzyme